MKHYVRESVVFLRGLQLHTFTCVMRRTCHSQTVLLDRQQRIPSAQESVDPFICESILDIDVGQYGEKRGDIKFLVDTFTVMYCFIVEKHYVR